MSDKNYRILMENYLKKINSNNKIIDEKIRSSTLKSVLNTTATFLCIDCENCGVGLVDPVGITIIQNHKPMKHARCGNCGYSGYTSYYTQLKI